MIKIGVIGCGRIAQKRHLPEYRDNPACTLSGYYDFNSDRAKEIASLYGGRAYESAEELIASPEIDAVSVCTSNDTHAALSIAALRAGKHVLCEKPMATTPEDCEKMVEEAKKSGKILMIGMNQRLARAHAEAKKLLAEGAIGKVISFQTAFCHGGPETWSIDPGPNSWFFDKKRAAMGAMADLGVHKTDLVQFLLGENVVKTTARVATLDKKYANGEKIGVDDNAFCIYETESGVLGTMHAGWTQYGPEDNSTVLFGTEGVMRLYQDPAYSVVIEKKNGEKILMALDLIQTNDHQTKSGVIDLFVDCLEKGEKSPLSAESVLPAMRTVFASLVSGETGKTVEIPENRRTK